MFKWFKSNKNIKQNNCVSISYRQGNYCNECISLCAFINNELIYKYYIDKYASSLGKNKIYNINLNIFDTFNNVKNEIRSICEHIILTNDETRLNWLYDKYKD